MFMIFVCNTVIFSLDIEFKIPNVFDCDVNSVGFIFLSMVWRNSNGVVEDLCLLS
jgi:hypothetical protein